MALARPLGADRPGLASPPLFMVGAALAFTVMGACVKLASERYVAGEIVFYRSLVGLALLLAIGILATAGQWMMTLAYATGATLGVAALQYLGIVFGFGFGVWLFDDPVTTLSLAGMALIIGAGVTATLLHDRRSAPGATPNEA
ncbi:MAG: hypothetical protein U5L05_08670 [Rubrivivax sp.]|nr:hypothetical protein [Rubrivivax sp.]